MPRTPSYRATVKAMSVHVSAEQRTEPAFPGRRRQAGQQVLATGIPKIAKPANALGVGQGASQAHLLEDRGGGVLQAHPLWQLQAILFRCFRPPQAKNRAALVFSPVR